MADHPETPAKPVELIRPCPFCGGTNLKSGGDDKVVGTWCLTCEASGPNQYGKHEWNDRALGEAESAKGYLRFLLSSFTHEHCNPVPEWAPLPDLMGMLTQIDNAITVVREIKATSSELLEALVMVRDADNDRKADGLPTIPRPARAKIDAAIAKAEGRS